jgi:hypothetical protein
VWNVVGLAARAAGAGATAEPEPADGAYAGHPLLGVKTADTSGAAVFRARYGIDELWMLNEHRLHDGQPLVPGAGYVEIARAALSSDGGHLPVEHADVSFVSP